MSGPELRDLVALDLLEPVRAGETNMLLLADAGEELYSAVVEICPN